jgi:putative hydrolase of the HAD superfamily
VEGNRRTQAVGLPTGELPPKAPKAIIFDIGRVIVRLNVKEAFGRLASHATTSTVAGKMPEQSHERIWTAIQADPHWRNWQEGQMTPKMWHEYISHRLRVTTTFDEFCAMWNSLLEPQTILSNDLFEQLSARYRLGLLSNTDPIHVKHLETHFSFVRFFQTRIYSNEVRTSKPSPVIYEAVLTALDVTPAEALYIDDIAEYADAARQIGLDAIHFENPRQLAGEFIRRGIPAPNSFAFDSEGRIEI